MRRSIVFSICCGPIRKTALIDNGMFTLKCCFVSRTWILPSLSAVASLPPLLPHSFCRGVVLPGPPIHWRLLRIVLVLFLNVGLEPRRAVWNLPLAIEWLRASPGAGSLAPLCVKLQFHMKDLSGHMER